MYLFPGDPYKFSVLQFLDRPLQLMGAEHGTMEYVMEIWISGLLDLKLYIKMAFVLIEEGASMLIEISRTLNFGPLGAFSVALGPISNDFCPRTICLN